MKFLKNTTIYLLCAIIACAPMTSCVGPLSKKVGVAMVTEIVEQQIAGELSPEVANLLISELKKRMDPNYSGGIDWDQILTVGGGILTAVIASVTGVRISRGPSKPLDKSQSNILQSLIEDYEKTT